MTSSLVGSTAICDNLSSASNSELISLAWQEVSKFRCPPACVSFEPRHFMLIPAESMAPPHPGLGVRVVQQTLRCRIHASDQLGHWHSAIPGARIVHQSPDKPTHQALGRAHTIWQSGRGLIATSRLQRRQRLRVDIGDQPVGRFTVGWQMARYAWPALSRVGDRIENPVVDVRAEHLQPPAAGTAERLRCLLVQYRRNKSEKRKT